MATISSSAMTPNTYKPALDLAKRFKLRTATATRLHPRYVKDGEQLDVKSSKLGGAFAWPTSQPWPRCVEHNDQLLFVLQLRREDAPHFPFRNDENLCQIFFCCQDHETTDGIDAVLFWRNADKLGVKDVQKNPIDEELERDYDYFVGKPRECRFYPEKGITEYALEDEETRGEIDEWLVTSEEGKRELDKMDIPEEERDSGFQYVFSTAPGIKFGGFPAANEQYIPVPCDKCGKDMPLLLQIQMDNLSDGRWRPSDVEALPDGRTPNFGGLDDECWVYMYGCGSCEQRVTKIQSTAL